MNWFSKNENILTSDKKSKCIGASHDITTNIMHNGLIK